MNTIKRIDGAGQSTARNVDSNVLFDSSTIGDVSPHFEVTDKPVFLRAFNLGDAQIIVEIVYSHNSREFNDVFRVNGSIVGLTKGNNMLRLDAKGKYRLRATEFGQMMGDAAVVLVQ